MLLLRVSFVFVDLINAQGGYYLRHNQEHGLLLEGLSVQSRDIRQSIVSLFSKSEIMANENAVTVDDSVLLEHKTPDGSVPVGKQTAYKTIKVTQLPETVFVRLERTADTITKQFSVLETVDFGSCREWKDGSAPKPHVLRLVGSVVHKGNTVDGGHYYSYVRHVTGQWYVEC